MIKPRRFVSAHNVLWARLLDEQPAFITRRRARGAKARGVTYERKAHEYLQERLIGLPQVDYHKSPWIEFKDTFGVRYCQPDAFILDLEHKHLCVVEVKYRHSEEAWWQLWRLYIPLAKKLYEGFACGALEVCKWFDPSTKFPGECVLTKDPLYIPDASKTAVHIFNPQRQKAYASGV